MTKYLFYIYFKHMARKTKQKPLWWHNIYFKHTLNRKETENTSE